MFLPFPSALIRALQLLILSSTPPETWRFQVSAIPSEARCNVDTLTVISSRSTIVAQMNTDAMRIPTALKDTIHFARPQFVKL